MEETLGISKEAGKDDLGIEGEEETVDDAGNVGVKELFGDEKEERNRGKAEEKLGEGEGVVGGKNEVEGNSGQSRTLKAALGKV